MLNILMLGVGQCGNRILDAVNRQAFGGGKKLSKYYSVQRFPSQVETIAINTAINDLREMKYTKAKDRLHIPHLHGVGANRIVGKDCFEENKNLVMRTIEERGHFDICFVITSTGGGTGSSFTPPLVEELKKQYTSPVYGIMVLPFRREGTIYLQNTAFCIKELVDSGIDGAILVDNQFLTQAGKDIQSAYDGINMMVAERLLFLIEALDSEMLMVTDLGDFKTVMSGGSGFATIGMSRSDGNISIRQAIQGSLHPSGLLFSSDVYEDAGRGMIIIEGESRYLDVDEIKDEVERLSGKIGHVFKGIVIKKGYPKVMSVISLEKAPELEKLYAMAVEAINFEKARKEKSNTKEARDAIFSKIDGLSPEY